MPRLRRRLPFALILFVAVTLNSAAPPSPASAPAGAASPLEDAFASGWMLTDTNGDDIPDFVRGKIVLPDEPSAAENAAAANFAARIGYATAGISLPLVVTAQNLKEAPAPAAISAESPAPHIWIGASALPQQIQSRITARLALLASGEGGVFLDGRDLVVAAPDAVGLTAAANAYTARAPYQWDVPGEKLELIARNVNAAFAAAKLDAQAHLAGVTFASGQPGIRRALLGVTGTASSDALRRALEPEGKPPVRFAAVRELVLLANSEAPVSIFNSTPLQTKPFPAAPAGAPHPLDLGTLFTARGLLAGPAKRPIPSSVDAHLYVPNGAAGTSLANFAARLGLETTGVTLPLASPDTGISPEQVQSQAVIAGDSPLLRHAEEVAQPDAASDEKSAAKKGEVGDGEVEETVPPLKFPTLSAGEGELRAVDDAFGRHAALLARGDAQGAAAALDYASRHVPNLWETDKQFASVEEIRYDLHRFFSLRSSEGQAAAALYHLDRWSKKLPAGAKEIEATAYVDKADPGLRALIEKQLGGRAAVRVGSLHAGLKCCDAEPALREHSGEPAAVADAKPAFVEDVEVPWEGRRLLDAVTEAVRGGAAKLRASEDVTLRAEVSESEAERSKLAQQLTEILVKEGAGRDRVHVEILCAFKPGYSWLMEDVAPALAGKGAAKLAIEFAPNNDPEHSTAIDPKARWVQELYPVDEMLARKLGVPLGNITLSEMASDSGPTYRVRAYSADGRELLAREYTVHAITRDYSAEFMPYDHVKVDTGWVHLESGGRTLLDRRIETDLETFWDHYQKITLPRIYKFVMAQQEGRPRVDAQPLFDTLRLQIHMSEPDYNLGLDHERISSLEALQEDAFYSTCNFFYMMGDLEAGGIFDYLGRVIPVVYPSDEGKDGRVHIEFYAKDGPRPLVRLKWKDASGDEHEKRRDLPALSVGQPQLVAARVRAGEAGVESLTWRLPADFLKDRFEEWTKLESEEQVIRTIFSIEQAEGQIHWLEAMHAAGMYRDALAYPHLSKLAVEFELPRRVHAPEHSKPDRVLAELNVPAPADKRPQISDYAPVPLPSAPDGRIVSWDEPIGPQQNAQILARLAKFPGVNVYWMGRSYLGENIWAADIMLPSPAELRSAAKETTLKASVIYSGRQHANEVSSTSHILRLAEQLVTDAPTREMLKRVNVVIHPITNPDGALMAMDLMKITPDNMLHPGYHGSLSADVVTAQADPDPIYPESRTRRLLEEAWLPDAFLNPHGYPSHEWIQPFSGYTAWVISRMGAEGGRTWWIPRGWFTSLNYLRDADHPFSKDVTYDLRERIADAMAAVPGALELNARMNDRYARFGQRWDTRAFQQPIYHGVRVYMALKGAEGRGAGAGGGPAASADVTWDNGYTEAPDETAHGEYLHLLAGEGLAFDRVHLTYLADGNQKIHRTEKEFFDGVQRQVDRDRPILPKAETPAKNAPPAPSSSQR